MKVSAPALRVVIAQRLNDSSPCLTLRIKSLLSDSFLWGLEKEEEGELDLFNLLVRLVLRADAPPADTIADLLIGMNEASYEVLEQHTISDAAAFIKDHLRKDWVLEDLLQYEERQEVVEDNEEAQEADRL